MDVSKPATCPMGGVSQGSPPCSGDILGPCPGICRKFPGAGQCPQVNKNNSRKTPQCQHTTTQVGEERDSSGDGVSGPGHGLQACHPYVNYEIPATGRLLIVPKLGRAWSAAWLKQALTIHLDTTNHRSRPSSFTSRIHSPHERQQSQQTLMHVSQERSAGP